jgi:hypothetical protein
MEGIRTSDGDQPPTAGCRMRVHQHAEDQHNLALIINLALLDLVHPAAGAF